MSTGLAAEPADARRPDDERAPQRRRAPGWALPAGLFALAAAVYAVLALRTPLPVLFPDELRYAHLARSLADGEGFTWRGDHVAQSAALYVYVLAPLWALWSSTVDAWHASKLLGVLLLCAQVFPIYLVGRRLLGPRGGLFAAALSVAGTWMLLSAGLVTEVLAMPLATAALCVAVAALARPGGRLWIAALALVLLAAWARIQLAVLLPALAAAFALDVARAPAGERAARLRAHRAPLVVLGGLSAIGLVVALARPSVAGDYAGVLDLRPSLGHLLRKGALQLAELTAAAGFVPVLLAAGAATSRTVWRDDRAGPLLAVFWPAALAVVAESGFFLAGFPPALSGIQRYVTYVAPLALLLMLVLVADRRLLLRPQVLGVAALGALALLARPAIAMIGEERAAWATSFRVHQVLGVAAAPALALVALLLLVAVATIVVRSNGPARALAAATALLLAVLVIQDQAAWHQMTSTAKSFRTVMPGRLDWIDRHADGPVALLALTQNAPQYENLEFFNRRITNVYVPPSGLPGRPVQGRTCSYRFTLQGTLEVGAGCAPMPRWFMLDDPAAAIRFRDERRSAYDPRLGRLVEVAPGAAPRAFSVVVLACPRPSPVYSSTSPDIVSADAPRPCNTTASGSIWLDAPATVALRYRGGTDPHAVTVAGRAHPIAPGADVTVRFAAPKGYSQYTLQQDWASTGGAPRLVAGWVEQAGGRTPILPCAAPAPGRGGAGRAPRVAWAPPSREGPIALAPPG